MHISEINISLFRLINNLGKELPFLDPIMIFMAEYMIFLLAIAALLFWFSGKKDNRIMIICMAITVIAAEILGKLAGTLYAHHQPFAVLTNVHKLVAHAVDNSFPSDHTILFFSICMTFYLFNKRWKYAWLGVAFLVGIARIWVGVHYPVDVAAGAFIGTFIALIIYKTCAHIKGMHSLINVYEKGENRLLRRKQIKKAN